MPNELDYRGVILRTGCATERARRLERRADLLRDTARAALGIAVLGFGLVALSKATDTVRATVGVCPPVSAPSSAPSAPGTTKRSALHNADLALIRSLTTRLVLQKKIGDQWANYANQLAREKNALARKLMRYERDS